MTETSHASPRVVTLFDVASVIASVKAYWISGALIGVGLGILAGFLLRPVYRAEAVVMPVASNEIASQAFSGLLSRLGGDGAFKLGESTQRDEAVAVLKSRQFGEKLIEDEQLLPQFFNDDWDAVRKKWVVAEAEDVPTAWDGWDYLDREVREILEDKERGLVTIRVDWFDPEQAARWANLMVSRANEEIRARKLSQLDRSLEYLETELRAAELVELRNAISQVMESQINERMLVNASPEYAFRFIDPALPADLDQPERPKRVLLALIGLVSGGLVGAVFGLAIAYRWSRNR